MDIHHNTSFRFILEDDSISFTSKAYIRFYLGKGVWLSFILKPFICFFCIALYFQLNNAFSSRFDLAIGI